MGNPYLRFPAGIELKASVGHGIGPVQQAIPNWMHSLCHTFWAVVFLCEHGDTQYGYSFELGSFGVIFYDFRVRTKIKYGGDTERPQLFRTWYRG
jgi:hypothetical protein